MSGAILLDALGTLLDLQPPGSFLRRELAERFDVLVEEADAERAIGAEITFYRQRFDEGRDQRSLASLRVRCAEVLRTALPEASRARLPPPPDLVEALLASLHFRVYPDVFPALKRFRARGTRLVVVSNWDVSLHERLREVGLTAILDGAVTSAEVGARKPSPAIFEAALHLSGVGARDAIHVGDSLDEDVAGARAAGIEPLLLCRNGTAPPGVRSIASLAELIG